VGKRLINSLSGRGHDGYVLEHKRKPALCSGLVSVPGSLSDVHTYSDYLRDVDVVIHLAATVDDWSLKDNYYKVILDGTKLLFEQSLNLGIKHFIFVSSLSVVNDTTDNIINEQSPYMPKPFCYYANSKIEAEKKLIDMSNKRKIKLTILRAGWVIGGSDSILLKNLGNRIDHIFLPTRGLRLPLTDIDQLSRLLLKVVETKPGDNTNNNQILHAVDFDPTWEEFVSAISRVIGKNIKIRYFNASLLWLLCLANYFVRRLIGVPISKKIISPTAYQLIVSHNRFQSLFTQKKLGITTSPVSLDVLLRRSLKV